MGDEWGADDRGEREAFSVALMLSNGMGGYDWAALPLACRIHGVRDVEMLIERLLVLKTHRAEE